jgi:hypothetical protein
VRQLTCCARDEIKGNINRFDPDVAVNRSFNLSLEA